MATVQISRLLVFPSKLLDQQLYGHEYREELLTILDLSG